MKADEICKNCKFFTVDTIDPKYGDEFPQCRRHAPRMFSGSGEGWSGEIFPKIKETYWCGEFESEDK